jgi:hypothetical protein
LVLAAVPVASEEPAAPSEWRYDAVLYGWLAGLEGTIGFGDALQEPISATFEDLLNYVDFALAGHFEAKNRSAVLLTDVSYTNLGSSQDAQVRNQTVSVDLDITQWIVELGGGYRVSQQFDVLVAGRYYILDTGATSESIAESATGEAEQSWGDIYVGARYSRLFREKWFTSIRGDIGAGGSDFAWYGAVALGYRFTDLLSGGVAWRTLSLDREADSDGNYFKYDVVQNGLGIGLGFSF